uniref:HIT-type domain-containing protein n=1 Tax=Trichobilharzia regenti TaxID=157069 RepID=A0AA85K0I6_TRIRE|nr:unnamed protein product [Trichobilharzia regenti]
MKMSDSLMTNDFTRSLICGLCMKKSAYVCPRCGINYCSLNCYRDERHKNCSESFYQDCCIQSLRSTFASQSERSSMTEILKRESSAMSEIPHLTDVDTKGNNEQISDEDDESDNGDDDDIQKRFKDLNLNDDNISAEVIWSRLTLKEKRDFNRFIESSNIIHFIPTWTPWWLEKKPVVTEVNQQQKNDTVKKSTLTSKKSLDQLLPSGILPHQSVGFVLADVLLGYAFIMRFYNGDCGQLIDDTVNLLCNIIKSFTPISQSKRQTPSDHPLKKDCNDDSVEGEEQRKKTRIIKPQTNSSYNIIAYNCINDVLSTIQYKLMEANLPCHPSIMILLLEDISHILGNIAYCTRALQELHTLVLKFRKMLRESSDDDSTAESILSKVNTAHRKLVFLQACLDDKNQMARRWQTLVLPRLWSEISTELIQRIHDMKDFNDAGRRQDSKSAGPNWRNMIRNSNSCDNNNTDRVLIEPVNTDS